MRLVGLWEIEKTGQLAEATPAALMKILARRCGASGKGRNCLAPLTRTLARERAPEVRVYAVTSGAIETRRQEAFSTPEQIVEYCRNRQAEAVAAAVLFLTGDAASFPTGALLDLNSGRFLR